MKRILLFLAVLPVTLFSQMQYPATKTVDQTDDYHGTMVKDPYRWLEDDQSVDTKEWVKEENQLTQSYLAKIPYREAMRKSIAKVYDYPKYSAPFIKNDYYYFYKNTGLQNQSELYRQKGIKGEPELVIDPNSLSADGTTRMVQFVLSKDGNHGAYAVSKNGSDWEEIYVMDMHTLKTTTDHIDWVKISGIAWQGDGFYYSRYPTPAAGMERSSKNENHQVYYHTIGTAQDKDLLIYEDKSNLQRFHEVYTSEDEKCVYLSISDRGKGLDGNALYYKGKDDKTFKPIVSAITDFSYSVIDNDGNRMIVSTNAGAKNYKVLLYKTGDPANTFATLIPEKPEPLSNISAVGGKLIITYQKDVSSRVYVYSENGQMENEITLPGIGSVDGFGGEKKDKETFYVFTSFTYPPTIFKYDIASRKSEVFRKPEVKFEPSDFETKQVFYKSKDGTKIPMVIVYQKGTKLNGTNPTLLYGYGGFNISLMPGFNPLVIPFIQAGGVYAQANLRGGSEYGESWHEQGMKLKKQNVFDDFIAAAEYLISEKYTDKNHLAINGRSNGGLLVGAVTNQRPDLFKVAIAQVGVMDMLRFQKFTIGWNWIADYGSSDSTADFNSLYKFSPLHNIKAGVNYPAVLINTADHDDRVVPAHSFKYAATLQAVAGKSTTNPLLIRIDTNSGHGSSNTQKNIDLHADIYSFIFYNMGVTPKL